VRKDHRPYYLKKLFTQIQNLYVKHFIKPQLSFLGTGFTFMKPWYVKVFGSPIHIGKFATLIASSDNKIRLSVWSNSPDKGSIHIGNYCMICPGVRIGSAEQIRIGDNCMIASNSYIADSDWHDIYNRIEMGKTAPVDIADNVWVGEGAIVCKGVSIGKNSIIGAGAVVVSDIPPNCISAGNPARIVKHLDPNEKMTTRAHFFKNQEKLFQDFDKFDRVLLGKNSLIQWLRHLVFPGKND
jgi:acetyltransferase-like isoleucine patch superfamily enzyme